MLGHGKEGVCASGFCLHWLKVHEPRSEDRLRQPFHSLRRLPILFNLVVEGSEDVGDGALFGEGWKWDLKLFDLFRTYMWDCSARLNC